MLLYDYLIINFYFELEDQNYNTKIGYIIIKLKNLIFKKMNKNDGKF